MSQHPHHFKLQDEDQLSLALIEAQYALKNNRDQNNSKSILILVSGIELAGKGEAVKQLREWVDPRYLWVKADPSILLNDTQPFWQPYVSQLPASGQVVVLFGNWYSDLLSTAMHATEPLDQSQFDEYVTRMRAFEQDLKNNQVDVIKFWFDLSWKTLQKRLAAIDPSEAHWHKLHGLNWRNQKQYEKLQKLRQRFTQDWQVIDGEDAKQRDQQFAQRILQQLQDCPVHTQHEARPWPKAAIPKTLLHPAQDVLDKVQYKARLKKLSRQVAELLRHDQRHVMIVFEGMDAAGKGGAIKRIVQKLDPREYVIHTIAAPEADELRRPYLWRFWNKLQLQREINIFDRSWYGRVLVERVEGFADDEKWQRAYEEINRFEQDLTDNNTVVIKFWLAISKEQQALRFKAREQTPHKRFKITAEDWRNSERWDDYLQAAADVLAQTDLAHAPWHVIATDDKYSARLAVLQHIVQQLDGSKTR